MSTRYYQFYFSQADALNPQLVESYLQLREKEEIRRTHFFNGRYENIYIDRQRIPQLDTLIEFWIACAAEVLGKQTDELRCGFWFNDMGPGDITLPHSHDDDDEWLSGVYYLKVPKNSGNLIMHDGEERTTIEAEEGKLVLFSSSNVHEVSENKSNQQRLSIGINFGRIDVDRV